MAGVLTALTALVSKKRTIAVVVNPQFTDVPYVDAYNSITTNPLVATVSNGVAPLTYVWTPTGGTDQFASTPTASSTGISWYASGFGLSSSMTWIVTVTDALSNVAVSAPVTVSFQSNNEEFFT